MYTYFKNWMLHSAPATEENWHVCSFISIQIKRIQEPLLTLFIWIRLVQSIFNKSHLLKDIKI